MKLAVTGKGGVGKTTVCALLAKALKATGHDVVAIDCDPDSNLAACMGYPHPERLKPLVELKALIEEKMGVQPGTTGGLFRLNPFVEDIPDRYAVDIGGLRVLVAGAVKKGGAGCYCPENALIRALIAHLLTDERTDLVLDMEAGVEHLSRGTVRSVDALLVVADPSLRAVETALRIGELAGQLGLRQILAIGNKIRSEKDRRFLAEALPGWKFAGFLPYDDSLRDAEMSGRSVNDGAGRETVAAAARITGFLAARPAGGQST
ncbi:MAG: AAA family ATPase [Kiritimatiellaeota bacterium]|nr:AAA family ATPase [Kiritimatiellota bacterium]